MRDTTGIREDVYRDPIRATSRIAADVAAIWAVLLEWARANPEYPRERLDGILESWYRALHGAVDSGIRMAAQVEKAVGGSGAARQFLLDAERREGRG